MGHRLFLAIAVLASVANAAYTPANRPYDVTNYKIRLTLDPSRNPEVFTADTDVRFKAKEAIESMTLDAEDLKISKVAMVKPDQRELKFTVTDKTVAVKFPGRMRKNDQWTIQFTYEGKINKGHHGLFKVTDPDDAGRGPVIATQFESTSARQFFPSNDEPYDKATTEMEITVPTKYDAISNGTRISDKSVKVNGVPWRRISWKLDKPHSTYLVSLAVGVFGKVEEKYKGKEISVYTAPSKTEKAKYALQVTKESMQFFENYFGVAYPWPRYSIVGIPTFFWGGMENTSSTHQNQARTALTESASEYEKVRITALSAHELAHQWFGNYVTMKWWDDLWLNEAFASYFGTQATKAIFRNEESDIWAAKETWDEYFRQEDGPRSHPLVDKSLSEHGDNFDAISYTKGEAVLRMLNFYVGEDKFKKGVKEYLTAHALKNTTYEDFFASVQKASGENLVKFRDSWLLQRGYPVLSYSGTWDPTSISYTLTLKQRSNHTTDKGLFQFRVPVAFHRRATPSYDRVFSVNVDQAERVDKFPLPAEPEWVTVNPGAVALVRLEPATRDEGLLSQQALSDPDPLARLWAAMELLRPFDEGKALEAKVETTIAQLLRSDPSPYTRIAVLDSFRKSKNRWLPSKLGDTVLELATAATQPSSERQPLFLSDRHGWREYRSQLIASVGKVKRSGSLTFASALLSRKDLPLDDLGEASLAVAMIGDDRAGGMLREAMQIHGQRGYRYRYVIEFAVGGWENPLAAAEINEIAKNAGTDLMGKMGGIVKDNHTLKNSAEWAQFLQEFTLKNTRFDEDVKARLLQSIEESTTAPVKTALEAIVQGSASERVKELAKKILDKNFAPAQG